mgnify:CR=1 FL=1
MHNEPSGYGLWSLVIINSLVFIIFAFSFARPQNARDWRAFGAFSAFIVALFTEMYGFPLTIYLLSGWLSTKFPGVDWLSHDAGHLLEMIFGWKANPHLGPFHIASNVLIGLGFFILAKAWNVLWAAQRAGLYYTAISSRLTKDETEYIINDCEAKAFVTSAYKSDVAIREGKIAQMYSSIQTGQKDGMQTLDQNLMELVKRNVITADFADEIEAMYTHEDQPGD